MIISICISREYVDVDVDVDVGDEVFYIRNPSNGVVLYYILWLI